MGATIVFCLTICNFQMYFHVFKYFRDSRYKTEKSITNYDFPKLPSFGNIGTKTCINIWNTLYMWSCRSVALSATSFKECFKLFSQQPLNGFWWKLKLRLMGPISTATKMPARMHAHYASKIAFYQQPLNRFRSNFKPGLSEPILRAT
jgi:hypothetical protein